MLYWFIIRWKVWRLSRQLRQLPNQLPYGGRGQRIAAACQLGELEDPLVVDPLIAALQDTDLHVRKVVVNGLAKSKDSRGVAPLVAALRDEDATVRRTVAGALDSLGWRPSSGEQQACYDVALEKYEEAAEAGWSAVEALLNCAQGWGRYIPYEKEKELTLLGERLSKALNRIQPTLRTSGPFHRDDERAVTSLVLALTHVHPRLRQTASSLLQGVGWQPGTALQRVLFALAKNDVDEVVALGATALDPLKAVVDWEANQIPSDLVTLALRSLEMIGTVPAIEIIASVCEPNIGYLVHLAAALERLAASDDSEPRPGAALVDALCKLCLEAPQHRYGNEIVISAAKRGLTALGKIGGARTVTDFIWQVQYATTKLSDGWGDFSSHTSKALKQGVLAATSLGRNGDARAVEQLAKALEEAKRMLKQVRTSDATSGVNVGAGETRDVSAFSDAVAEAIRQINSRGEKDVNQPVP